MALSPSKNTIDPSLHYSQRKHQKEDPLINLNTNPNDHISRLPDEVLCRIISLLPFESAVRTSFLSTRWKNLWKMALLTLVDDASLKDVVAKVMDFLEEYCQLRRDKCVRHKWGFQLDFGHGEVLLFAVAPNGTLHFDFSSSELGEPPHLSDWFLKSSRKTMCRSRSPSRWSSDPSSEIWSSLSDDDGLTSSSDGDELTCKSCIGRAPFYGFKLNSLYLTSVSCLSNKTVSSIASKLPHLRRLTIAKCQGLESLAISHVDLQKLVILDCPCLESLDFKGESLISFGYRGKLISVEFESQERYHHDLFELKDAMLYIKRGGDNECINTPEEFLQLRNLKSAKYLTLSTWIFEMPYFSKEFYLKKLEELWWIIDSSASGNNVNALLCFLRGCPRLKRLYITMDPESFQVATTKSIPHKVEGLENLELLKLEGFPNEGEEITLAKQLRPFFKRKPLIIAKSVGTRQSRRLIEVLDEDEEQGECSYNYLVEEVKNVHEICHDHIHMKF